MTASSNNLIWYSLQANKAVSVEWSWFLVDFAVMSGLKVGCDKGQTQIDQTDASSDAEQEEKEEKSHC